MRIGIFDSGLGGLTVAREIKNLHANQSIVYIGDTARVPWGIRSPKIIESFSLQLLSFLLKKQVDMIVVACHTASCVAIPALERTTQLKVTGVIEPSAKDAVEKSKSTIGIIGTPTTIRSQAWPTAINLVDPTKKVVSNAAPLLVPIVEEGLENHEVAKIMVSEYTKPLIEQNIDTLVLACTHYPLLYNIFEGVLGESVIFINPGESTARSLEIDDLEGNGEDEFYFTDLSDRVKANLEHFYGREIKGKVEGVEIESL
ncbi:glutamate racemase [Candidatus Woesebacteria bacterium]|nr:glutamate racemase [Candidatus Woesebacteria bacterium]